MARIEITGDMLNIHVEGLDRLWALRSHLEIPLAHVTGAAAEPEVARRWFKGAKLPGANLPGVLTAGSFYLPSDPELQGWTFWDVHDPEKAVVITLDHEHFKRLVVGVADPAAAVSAIQAAVGHRM